MPRKKFATKSVFKKLEQGLDLRSKSDPSDPAGTKKISHNFRNSRNNTKSNTKSQLQTEINALTLTHGKKYYVKTLVFNRNVNLLLDTGSQVNVLPKHVLNSNQLRNLKPSTLDIKSYSGNKIEVFGILTTDISMGNIKLKNVEFFVVDNLFKPILGTPALQDNNIAICFSKNTIIQNGSKIAKLSSDEHSTVKNHNLNLVAIEKKMETQILQLEIAEPIKIKPNCENIIKCTTRYSVAVAGDYAIEPESAATSLGLVFGKSVSTFSDNNQTCLLRVCNVTDTVIEIPARTRIVNAAQVSVLETNFQQPLFTATRINKILSEVKITTKNLEIKQKTEELVRNYHDVFACEKDDLGETPAAEYDIDTGVAPPQAQQRYRTPYYLRDEMHKIITKNVQSGLMSPCSSPWAAPVLLVKKSNGSWRLVCDYRKLNQVTVSDSYPLPEITDLVTDLAVSKVFSISDLFTGFHQIPCSERAKEKLAITTELGQFTWNRMPMGAKNCPAVFQRLMDNVFRKIPRSKMIIYLDDLLVHTETEMENIKALEEVFQLLRKNNLKLRADKTELVTRKVKFCGYEIENGQKRPSLEKIEAIKQLQAPTSKKEAQSIFGLLNYHRTFIDNFASKATAITRSYRGEFKWTNKADIALKTLKKEVGEAALKLEIPNMKNAQFILETDASNQGYGAVLFICSNPNLHAHHGPNCLRPVEYASGMFSPAQLKYQTMEKELFCGKIALHKWSHYLLGRKFTWRTDNACLTWASRIRSRNFKISSWLATIGQFDFTIELRPSKTMKITDCLSRQFPELNSLRVSKQNLAELQASDPVLHFVKTFVASNRWPNRPEPEFVPYLRRRANLFFGSKGELLLNENNRIRTIPAEVMKMDIIRAYHDKNGHPGEQQCIQQLGTCYFWPGLTKDIKEFIKSCHQCQITKPNLHPRQAPQGLSETPNDAWEFIAFDLIGPLHITENGHRYALVGIDIFSKKVYATALTSKHSSIVGREIRRILMSFPKMPKTVLTDNGGEFATISTLCNQLGIKHNLSAPYHPQTNGAVERANQTLKSRIYASENSETWDDALDEILHSINCSTNIVTGYSPFQVETGLPGRNIHDGVEHEVQARENVAEIRNQTKAKIVEEKRKRNEQHQKPNFKPFENGDLVLMKNRTSKHPRFLGPLKITEVRAGGLSYNLQAVTSGVTFQRHCSQLKSYTERPLAEEAEEVAPDDHVAASQPEGAPVVWPVFIFPVGIHADNSDTPAPAEVSSAASDQQLFTAESNELFLSRQFSAGSSSPEPAESEAASSDTPSQYPNSTSPSISNAAIPAPSISAPPSSQPSSFASEPASSSTAPSDFSTEFSTSVIISSSEETEEVTNNDETIYDSLASDDSSTVSETSNTSQLLAFTIEQLTIKELQNFAQKYDVAQTGSKKELKKRLELYIKSTFSDWPTDENGLLLFEADFAPSTTTVLSTKMSKNELLSILKSFKLPFPSRIAHLGFISKDAYVKHIDAQMRLSHPNHSRNDLDVLIFQPENKNLTPTPFEVNLTQ